MKFIYIVFILFLTCLGLDVSAINSTDTILVEKLNKEASALKFSEPLKGIKRANDALKLSQKIGYQNGLAESLRIIGLNYSVLNKIDSCIKYYHKALEIFKKNKNTEGIARCYNNLGGIYKGLNQNQALKYYKIALSMANKSHIPDLIAGCNSNIGTLYIEKNDYKNSIPYFEKAISIFLKISNNIGLATSYSNIAMSYYYVNEITKSEEYAIKALEIANENRLETIKLYSYDILAYIYVYKNILQKAQNYADLGYSLAKKLANQKYIYEYKFLQYEIELKKQNYKLASEYLKEVHSLDSIEYQKNLANIVKLNEEQIKNAEIQKQYEVGLERQKNNRILFMAAIIVSILSAIIIFILIRSKRKTEKSNQELIALNKEVIRQKEDLDRINLKLEEIIAERTKDLLSKNQKLSEYSYHLSHQVRGPVATLKGLIMLSQDNLIEEKECIVQMKKCVDDIDEQIMDINIALHDPSRHGLKNPNQDSGNL
ncbi:tetratricopeptide repeat protein [Pedobacter aquae]|uniref:Tetratricopeptide repeat protein n=1 Tax=Pedobacter aquae TaxID=2605747 RepID=A0A5C0VJG8_9SPHI|nr:tetratricopeptide repeat protein [Pedobacter aquae]QEK51144.1 tetratricopeptide repeat protein [Pedobacter aquae]